VPVALWICAATTIASAAVSSGHSLGGLRESQEVARTASTYALARSGALLAAAIAGFVAAIATAMVFVQSGDAVIGARIGDRVKTLEPGATTFVNLGALVAMLLEHDWSELSDGVTTRRLGRCQAIDAAGTSAHRGR
jgi:hypothetical protein